MKIALIGYGKMGKTIDEIARGRGHEIVARFGREGIDPDQLKQADVAIEFSKPEVALHNIIQCMHCGVPVVVGTTGWLDKYEEAVAYCRDKKGGLLVASNFSLGVNIFFAINKKLAEYMNEQPSYEVEIEEIHHLQKLDAPSGTAISLAEQISEKHQGKNGWSLNPESADQIKITAHREEDVKGTHKVSYKSETDTIVINHIAHSRAGFALGAVIAAEFMAGKQGVYRMQDVLNL